MFDSIIIGAGIAGAVAARELAERGNKKVLVIDARDHIGGNCYDEADKAGVLVHNYGPHIFHTNDERVYAYLSRFTEWFSFRHKVVADVHGKLLPVPFNLNTLRLIYDADKAAAAEQKLIAAYGEGSRVPILKLREHPEQDIRDIADFVYENIFLHYTMKQWGQKPEDIDPAVTGRVPVIISTDDAYFQDKYQGMPKDGYTSMFEQLLDHPGITCRLSTDARSVMEIGEGKILFEGSEFTGDVIYTGPLDELFDCRFGRLPYRSLDFLFENYQQDDYQGHGVINYTVSEDYTRITEFKHLTGQKIDGTTTIVREYPVAYTAKEGQIPYYAINNADNDGLHKKYLELVEKIPNFYPLGRLAEYKYYNIDAMAGKALDLAEKLL